MVFLYLRWLLVAGFCLLTTGNLPARDLAALEHASHKHAAQKTTRHKEASKSAVLELQHGITKGLARVHEFQVLAEKAQELDIKAVYLFGGAAATLAHYVQRDLVHQHMQNLASMGLSSQASQDQSAPAFDETEFNYTLWSMLFHNQDIDIVVDTHDQQKIQQLKEVIQTALPMTDFKWDFWGLNIDFKNRPALLTSQDVAHQHTDSHSTILMPVYLSGHQLAPSLAVHPPFKKTSRTTTQSQPPQQQPQIYDLRDKLLSKGKFDATTATSGHATQFLTDVLEKKLSCYYSAKHHQSPRYKKGNNPEIFFAIRTLAKAFQYGLDIPDNCINRIQKIFKNFKADRDLKTDYSQYWIEKNAKKLYTHSIDLERSQRVLQQLGALEVLKSIGNTNKMGSMAWWLDRQPLLSRPIHARPVNVLSQKLEAPNNTEDALSPQTGASTEKNLTAAQLGLHYVVHNTPSIEAYESIVRSHDQKPNVFISRASKPGERAIISGDGFYTASVNGPIAHTPSNNIYGPLRICFRVHPQARQNIDFIFSNNGHTVIFKNKEALNIANDSVSKDIEYFNAWLAQDESDSIKFWENLLENKAGLLLFVARRHSQHNIIINKILKVSRALDTQQYVKFWAKFFPVIPAHYIYLNYEKFLPPEFERHLHLISISKARSDQWDKKVRALLQHFLHLDAYIHAHETRATIHPQHEKLINTLLNFAKHLNGEKYYLFWIDYLQYIPSRYIALKHNKFLPHNIKNFIHDMSSTKINKKIREELPLFFIHFSYISNLTLTYATHRLNSPTIIISSPFTHPPQVWKGHWQAFLKKLIIKMQNTQPHKPTNENIDLMFEALLARVMMEEKAYRDLFENRTPERSDEELMRLIKNVLVDRVHYFIENNYMLILRALVSYVVEDSADVLLPSEQLTVLETIINHETRLTAGQVSENYNLHPGLAHDSDRGIYFPSALDVVAKKFISLEGTSSLSDKNRYPYPRYSVRFSHSYHSSLTDRDVKDDIESLAYAKNSSHHAIVRLIRNRPSNDVNTKWPSLQNAERLFNKLYKQHNRHTHHHYDTDYMVEILMRRHWARQPWALELVERMVNDSIKKLKHLKKPAIAAPMFYMIQGQSADILHGVLRIILNLNSKNQYDFKNEYDYEYLRSHPKVLQILEKVIMAHYKFNLDYLLPTSSIDKALNTLPSLRSYFANKYFDAQEDFSALQLRDQMLQHGCSTVLTQLSSNSE